MAHLGAHVLGEQRLSADEIQLPQGLEDTRQFIKVRTYLVGHLSKDADDFASDFGLGLTNAVICLDDGVRLNEHGLARCTLVMDDAMQFAFVHGTHGQHQATVTQRGLHVVVKDAFLLSLGDDAPQGAVDAAGHTGYRHAQLVQVRRSGVLDVARLVEHMTDGCAQLGERLHAAGQFPQPWIRRIAVAVGGKEAHHLPNSHQQALQVKQAFGGQEGAGRRHLLEHDTKVKIVTQREFLAGLDDRQELVSLLEPAHDLVTACRETQAGHISSAQGTHAVAFQFTPHGIKAYLGLKC